MVRTPASAIAFRFPLWALLVASAARADLALPTGFRDSTIFNTFGVPVAMAFVPGPPEKGWRLLVLNQKGQYVEELVNGVLGPTPPFGHISEVDWVSGERGCLSLAVDPRWPLHPYVYLHYTSTTPGHRSRGHGHDDQDVRAGRHPGLQPEPQRGHSSFRPRWHALHDHG